MTGEEYFARLANALKDNLAYPADARMVAKLKDLGIEPGKDFDPTKLDPAVRQGINAAPAEVWKQLPIGPYKMKNVTGWINMLHLGR